MTERISLSGLFVGPALAVHTSLPYLSKVTKAQGITDVVYVPWMSEELEKYVTKFDSTLVV